jgi:hypothetical protein
MAAAVLALAASMVFVNAASSIWSCDQDLNPRSTFYNDEGVVIQWSGAPTRVDVVVQNGGGSTVFSANNQFNTYSADLGNLAADDYAAHLYKTGDHATEYSNCNFHVHPRLVLPESAFGALTSVIACFAALALFGVYRSRRTRVTQAI